MEEETEVKRCDVVNDCCGCPEFETCDFKPSKFRQFIYKIKHSFTCNKLIVNLKCKKYAKKAIKREIERVDKEVELASYNIDSYTESCLKNAVECYKEVYKLMFKAGHSGYSHNVTVKLLKRLLDEKPLTAITEDDFWLDECQFDDNYYWYHCSRYSPVYKHNYKEAGIVKYYDYSRCVNIDEITGSTYGNQFADGKLTELGLIPPVTMPYYVPDKQYQIFTLDIYYGEIALELDNNYSYRYIDYFITPDCDKIKVNRLYTFDENIDSYVEITDTEEKKKVVKLLKSQIKIYEEEKKNK